MRRRRLILVAAVLVVATPAMGMAAPDLTAEPAAGATTPVSVDENTYQAFGRVFPDPHGCFVRGGAPTGEGISPWAKGNVCAVDYLGYTDVAASETGRR